MFLIRFRKSTGGGPFWDIIWVYGPRRCWASCCLKTNRRICGLGGRHQGNVAVETASVSAGPPQAAVDAQPNDQCQGPQGEAPVNRDLRLQAHMAESTPLVCAIVTCHDPDEPPAETTQSETSNQPGGTETHSHH